MSYVDGFVVPVPRKNLPAYRRMAKKTGRIWKEYGALDYQEWVGDDTPVGKLTSFPRSVKLKRGEIVIFAWVVYKSRADRDRINAKVTKDPRLADIVSGKNLPFDGKRLIYGGFKLLLAM
jgi:uncharacterized protein YbaA (DUF1428 family)